MGGKATVSEMTIGFIGLGAMGAGMAGSLVRAGWRYGCCDARASGRGVRRRGGRPPDRRPRPPPTPRF